MNSRVEIRTVSADEAGMRLDRWFRLHYPGLGHGRLEKLLRTGQVRLDGARAKAGARLVAGARIRVPPLGEAAGTARRSPPPPPSEAEAEALRRRVLHIDKAVIVLNKPAGLAVQGGSRTTRHLDALLDALTFDEPERPRLVHRLDKDTSGVLVLARSRASAARLGRAFRAGEVNKLYWALVVGVPRPGAGRLETELAKQGARGRERMQAGKTGRRAVTDYAVIEAAGRRAAWLALRPLTGRTHQLRVHCAMLGTPIVGDGKYGGSNAFLGPPIAKRVHLHAREIEFPHPAGGRLRIRAPLEAHMLESWKLLGFDPDYADDPWA